MTIQIPNVGTGVPADQTGDSPWLAMKKVAQNFSDPANAASRLVGAGAGNVMGVGAFGLGSTDLPTFPVALADQTTSATGFYYTRTGTYGMGDGQCVYVNRGYWIKAIYFPASIQAPMFVQSVSDGSFSASNPFLVLDVNATKDSNGFLKGASPVVDLYDNKIGLNHDAKLQPITFEKVSVGSYLVKGSLGFAQEGWYIETPKDANGNVLVAVVYEQLANNDLSIKTYAKRFDDETGDIIPNLLKPRDIPTGRFISLRLHELPKEPPVMPTEPKTEV